MALLGPFATELEALIACGGIVSVGPCDEIFSTVYLTGLDDIAFVNLPLTFDGVDRFTTTTTAAFCLTDVTVSLYWSGISWILEIVCGECVFTSAANSYSCVPAFTASGTSWGGNCTLIEGGWTITQEPQ